MTVLSAARRVAVVVGLDLPDRMFGATDRTAVELGYLAQAAAESVANDYDWRALARPFFITGDGKKTRHALPADFGRFRMAADLLIGSTGLKMNRSGSPETIVAAETRSLSPVSGTWGLEGRNIVTIPALPIGEKLTGVYQSGWFVTGADGTAKPNFTADSDNFALPDRLLALAMIWQWKANKGLPYGQDFENYEQEKGQEIGREGDRGVITLTHRSRFVGHIAPFCGTINVPEWN